MFLDPRTPVIVGVGQLTLGKRSQEPTASSVAEAEPVMMMARASQAAAADAGPAGRLLERIDEIDTVQTLSWDYFNPGRALADELQVQPGSIGVSTTGGNSPLLLTSRAAQRIARGEADTVLVAGAESVYTRRKLAFSNSHKLAWSRRGTESSAPPIEIGDRRLGSHPYELEQSLALPVNVYPVFETALRHELGLSPSDHLRRISGIWSRLSEVAAGNPSAWTREPKSPDEIASASPANRMVSYPYTKLLTANIQTDQAAAIILTSVETAEALSIPKYRWVFPVASAFANDYWFVSERTELYRSPAISACAAKCFEQAGVSADDVSFFDLYSCFPSAFQIAAAELGIDPMKEARPLSMTGGLTFAGGPGNNYATHSICRMVEALRAEPESLGMVTGVGWFMTKHHAMIFTASPTSSVGGFSNSNAQPAHYSRNPRPFGKQAGRFTIEAYTVAYDREGEATKAICACLTPDGSRVWAGSGEADVMSKLEAEDLCGRDAEVDPSGLLAI